MKSTRKLLGITVVLLTIAGLATGVSAFSITGWTSPSSSAVISGTVGLNITVSTGSGVNQTIFYHNDSGSFAELGIDDSNSTPDQTEWNTSFDTTVADDGALLFSANATNTTGHTASSTREVTVDNSGPTFNIFSPEANANLTGSSYFTLTNVEDEYTNTGDTVSGDATFAFENKSGAFTSDGSGGWQELSSFNASRFNDTITPSGVTDGEYDLTFNVSDEVGNDAEESTTVHVDTTGPEITFNSHANEVDATVTDEPWPAADQIEFALNNTENPSSSDYLNGTGASGENTTLDVQDDGSVVFDINASDFSSAGNYTLTIWAEDVNGNTARNRTYLHIDGEAPTIDGADINDSNGTTNGVFSFDIAYSDNVGVNTCEVAAYDELGWRTDSSPIATEETDPASSPAEMTLDLTGRSGNYTFQTTCTDYGDNTASDRNVTEGGGSGDTLAWFSFDNQGPVLSRVNPENESYSGTDPDINATVADYTEVDDQSITVSFNGTDLTLNEDYTLNGSSDNETITIDINLTDSLTEGKEYRVTVDADDTNGFSMGETSYNFTVDSQPPSFDIDRQTDGAEAYDGDETWFGGDIEYDVTCTDQTAGINEYMLESGDDVDEDLGDGQTSGSNSPPVTLAYRPNDGFEEEDVTLNFTCTDNAGNLDFTTRDVNIDTEPPDITTQQPTSDKERDSLPYDQTIRVGASDDGSGFKTGWGSDLDPHFDELSADSDYGTWQDDGKDTDGYTYAEVYWDESVDEGTHTISLNGEEGTYTFEDAVGNERELSYWTYDVSLTSEQQENGDTGTTSTDANLDITNAPSSISMVPGRQRTIDLTIENDGDSSADADIDADSDNSDLTATADPDSADIDGGDTRAVDLELDANDDFSGTAEVTLEVTYGGNSDTITIDVDANPGSPDLTITDAPDEIDVWDNGTATSISVSVENTGLRQATGLDASVTGFNVDADQLDVPAGETAETAISISTEDRDVGTYTETLRLSNDDQTVSQQLEVKVQPTDSDTRNNITLTISSLGSQVSEIQDPETRNDLQELVSEAQSAIADEDYAEAASLRDQIQSELQSAETDDGGGSGLPILLILGVLGIAALAAGALAYIFLIRPEQTQGDGSGEDTTAIEFGETGSRIEHIGKTLLQTTEAFIDAVERAIGNIIDSISGSEETDSSEDIGDDGDDAEVNRKKIRFDDV